jgi:hypothetical protein
MRTNQWFYTLILLSSFSTFSVYAADQAPAPKVADTRLEKIADTPATSTGEMKDCPMHQGKKECDHKKGEPCPYHKDKTHHGKSHEKCEHEHRS